MKHFPMFLRIDERCEVLFGDMDNTAPTLVGAMQSGLPNRLGLRAAIAMLLRRAVAKVIALPVRPGGGNAAIGGQPQKAAHATPTAPEPDCKGHIALVGAGPGARDLLTMRAVQRLREADVILYDRLVDPDVLDLASRDAERIYVGKEVGACAWPQDRIDRLIVSEAAQGKRVVRLKSGDPSIFGRASEEIAVAAKAGIDVEIVPGITAASAAAATLTRPLTERGETDTFVITTGTGRPGDAEPERALLARPGTSIAFYMAVEKAARVQTDLLRAGAPADCPVDVVASVCTDRQRHVSTTLGHLSQTIEAHGIASPALLMVRYPKSLAAARNNRSAA